MNRGNFFSVELDAFYSACELGMNAACLYLVMAMGADRSGATTSWSCNALEMRTSISRRRAKEAQRLLLHAGLICQTKAGKHPQFKFKLQKNAEKVYLPNELIHGAANEVTPLELMRQGGDVMALRLFVDLYAVTNFADDGGVNADIVLQEYEGKKVGEVGEFAIWGFDAGCNTIRTGYPIVSCHKSSSGEDMWREFWSRLQSLQQLGLCRYMPVLFDGPDGEIIHPLENPFTGESMTEITYGAVERLMEDRLHADIENYSLVIPIYRHIRNPVVKGVLALMYRQKTQLTAAGYQVTQERWDNYQGIYENIGCTYQGDIKGTSRGNQRGVKGISREISR